MDVFFVNIMVFRQNNLWTPPIVPKEEKKDQTTDNK